MPRHRLSRARSRASTGRTTVPGVLARTRPGIDGALRRAAELVAGGFRVAIDHEPGDDAAAELAGLIDRVQAAGLSAHCEFTLPVDRLGEEAAVGVAEGAGEGFALSGIALSGRPEAVSAVSARLPGARVVVPAAQPGAEARCRVLADGRVRLTAGRGARADLAFVRCLNVLMAGGGHLAVAATDPRLVAIAGERAAWNDRTPDSWEHVMPYGVRRHEQQRLLAAGYPVRVVVRSRREARP
jgi:proline dehydrogenase